MKNSAGEKTTFGRKKQEVSRGHRGTGLGRKGFKKWIGREQEEDRKRTGREQEEDRKRTGRGQEGDVKGIGREQEGNRKGTGRGKNGTA